jgi:hypothetical protein
MPRQTRFRRRALKAAGLVSLLLVALLAYSLLRGGDEESPLNPIAAAAERTQSRPGARYTMEADYTSEALEGPMTATGHGAFNSVSGLGEAQMKLNVPGLGRVGFEMVNDEESIYMRSDNPALMPFPDGKEWMKVDPFLGVSQNELMFGGDPESSLQMLAVVGGDVHELGEETVRGRETRRYRTSFRFTQVAEVLREKGNAELADLYEKMGELNPDPTMTEVWVDDKEVLRRMRLVMELPVEGQPPLTMDMQMEFFDYGAEPEVKLPDEDDVFDATPILEEKLEETETD